VNNYLALGGDGFTAIKSGTAPQFGIYDSDALFAYFGANSPLAPTTQDRITRAD
jgi:5'-nucleotidase